MWAIRGWLEFRVRSSWTHHEHSNPSVGVRSRHLQLKAHLVVLTGLEHPEAEKSSQRQKNKQCINASSHEMRIHLTYITVATTCTWRFDDRSMLLSDSSSMAFRRKRSSMRKIPGKSSTCGSNRETDVSTHRDRRRLVNFTYKQCFLLSRYDWTVHLAVLICREGANRTGMRPGTPSLGGASWLSNAQK